MSSPSAFFGEKSRLRALLDHFSVIEDPREPWRVAHPLAEALLLVVCGAIADCDDYDHIAAWGEAHLSFLREMLPYEHGVPGGRWLTLLMNRIDPGLFSACFTAWVRETWPDRPDIVAIDGKTSRRSHNRSTEQAALHLVSAFAATSRLVLGQEPVSDKSNETTAIPILVERLPANDGLKGATVSIDAIACNANIANAITRAGARYLLAVKANQPTLRAEVENYFPDAPCGRSRLRHRHRQGAWPHRRALRLGQRRKPTGLPVGAVSPANSACLEPKSSSRFAHAPNSRIVVVPIPAFTSLPPILPLKPPR